MGGGACSRPLLTDVPLVSSAPHKHWTNLSRPDKRILSIGLIITCCCYLQPEHGTSQAWDASYGAALSKRLWSKLQPRWRLLNLTSLMAICIATPQRRWRGQTCKLTFTSKGHIHLQGPVVSKRLKWCIRLSWQCLYRWECFSKVIHEISQRTSYLETKMNDPSVMLNNHDKDLKRLWEENTAVQYKLEDL